MRLISELLGGKQNTKRSNNSGQGELPLPCFFHALKRYLHRLPLRCWLQRLQKLSKPVSI